MNLLAQLATVTIAIGILLFPVRKYLRFDVAFVTAFVIGTISGSLVTPYWRYIFVGLSCTCPYAAWSVLRETFTTATRLFQKHSYAVKQSK